jgi:hypothetical protein
MRYYSPRLDLVGVKGDLNKFQRFILGLLGIKVEEVNLNVHATEVFKENIKSALIEHGFREQENLKHQVITDIVQSDGLIDRIVERINRLQLK